MVNEQLENYVKQQLGSNMSKEKIKAILLSKGWPEIEIENSFSSINPSSKSFSMNSSSITDDPAINPIANKQSTKIDKKVLIIIAIVVGLLIVGGGVFAYFKYFTPPEIIVQENNSKISDVKSSESNGELKTEVATVANETAVVDTDKDGLPDQVEAIYGTDPTKADTDGDGFSDYDEIKNSYNPLGSGKLSAEMPKLSEVLNSVATSTSIKDRDAKRIADIKQMMSTLELYYVDAGKYPPTESVKSGSPIRFNSTVYMTVMPSNPTPNNDGSCPDNTNYTYKSVDNNNSYTLDYCLGEAVGTLAAGKQQVTPLTTWNFSINNSSKKLSVNQTSLLPTVPASPSSPDPDTIAFRDGKRFADVRQIMAVLELYFNDSGDHYPPTKDVNPGKPISYNSTIYMAVVPSNRAPSNDGSCPKNNAYVYNRIDKKDGSQSYTIDFCLGGAFGTMQAGKHKATPLGVDKTDN